ncbi:unnamed protein product [Didymodactylos carnosus]|uniref:Uncharacterized protein n=1 Tax=Didymodactylos carnosus TaxID=1234261 RepID=A0A815UTQ7_9BILA|nr:unnamed protein product [Didymodactylos carnosus]CAF1521646.1 unnamed protein product [Didymodactylos carnosus]CAF4197098.1 unnamed protein product [Didymodactylos carnosus]CAF4380909.1 unnamed protein product [Didymodactylos carnosus]
MISSIKGQNLNLKKYMQYDHLSDFACKFVNQPLDLMDRTQLEVTEVSSFDHRTDDNDGDGSNNNARNPTNMDISFNPLPHLHTTSEKTENKNSEDKDGFDSNDDYDNDQRHATLSNYNNDCLSVADKNQLAWKEFHMINTYSTQLDTNEFYEHLEDLKHLFLSWTGK